MIKMSLSNQKKFTTNNKLNISNKKIYILCIYNVGDYDGTSLNN